MVQATPGSTVTSLASQLTAYNLSYRASQGIVQGNGADWFGPLNPMAPVAPPEVAGRVTDFNAGYNLEIAPRPYEPIKFSDLRNLADNYDILRLVIETRKDQMERLKWNIAPRLDATGLPMADENDSRIGNLLTFFNRPDGVHFWSSWLRMLLEDLFVIDAPTIFRRRTFGGKLASLEIIDGATIKRVIDDWGKTPIAPAPAYQQILKGFPAVNYTTKDMLYLPRNPRVHKFYGYSPVEQVIMAVNIALRRELFQLQYYTEGNMPEALVGTPDLWTPDQIAKFQTSFDAMLAGNMAARRRIKFIPGGVAKSYVATKEPDLTGKQDEWLARVVCFCFSISPQPFVSSMNRATAQTAHDAAQEEGLAPIQNWVKQMVDTVLLEDFGITDLEFTWADDREVDQKSQMETLTGYVENGVIEINEAREVIGQDPKPEGAGLRVKTATGYVKVEINDDAPTAGEAADTAAENAQAHAEALANQPAGDGTNPDDGGKTPPDKGGKQPNAKDKTDKGGTQKSDRPFALTKRALPKGLKRLSAMSHEGKAVLAAEKRYAKLLRREFAVMAAEAAKAALKHYPTKKLAKADDEDDIPEEAANAAAAALDWDVVEDATKEQLAAMAQNGGKEALATLGLDDDQSIVDQTYTAAEEWAADSSAELITRISDSTRDMVREAVADAIDDGLSAQDLAGQIEEYGFSADRALRIARTEIVRANNQGHMAAFRASGVVQMKEWTSADDEEVCDDCQECVDDGAIPLDDEFSSGDDAPPAHPNCRCVLVPIVSSDEGDDGGDDQQEGDDE